MVKFSREQITYIRSPILTDTKLIACAGSGKTRTIIGRLSHMGKQMSPNFLYAVTFSRCAASDFRAKIKDLYPTGNHVIENYSTIDSLARAFLVFLGSHKAKSVDIMTPAFLQALRSASDETIARMKTLKDIRHLWVDEAQDLNQDQYEILCLMKQRFGTIIHLVGDPNQNVYQFRGSKAGYFLGWPGKEFELTTNYRSSHEIVKLSECLKPHGTTPSRAKRSGPLPILKRIGYLDIRRNGWLIDKIKNWDGDLSEIAIICPTKGNNAWANQGLSIYFNALKSNGIPVNQMYDERGSIDITDYVKVPGHVNLATYHNTKGLEFEMVFVMDCSERLMICSPSESQHNEHRYLLYVAMSRAIRYMYICCFDRFNSWLNEVDKNLYISRCISISQFKTSMTMKNYYHGIDNVIRSLKGSQINEISDLLDIKSTMTQHYLPKRVFRKNDAALFGKYCERLFYLQHDKRPSFPIIDNIIHNEMILVTNDIVRQTLQRLTAQLLDWNQIEDIDGRALSFIAKKCSRDKPFYRYMFVNQIFENIVSQSLDDIKKAYESYKIKPWRQCYKDLFYLVVVIHAYETNHHYHIRRQGVSKAHLLRNMALFESMTKITLPNSCQIDVRVSKEWLIGEIDVLSDEIIEIKCTSDISISHYIQLMMYGYCLNKTKYRLINLLTGREYVLEIKPKNMNLIMQIIKSACQVDKQLVGIQSAIESIRV